MPSAPPPATIQELADKNGNGWEKFEVQFGGFANLPSEKGEKVLSPEFTCFGSQWRLQLYPGGNNISEDGMVAFYLENLSDKSITIHSSYEFGGRAGRGWKNFCKRSDMVDALVDGTLVVEIKLKVAESL